MPRVIVLLIILLLVVYLVYRFRKLTPEKQKKIAKTIIFTGVVVLMAILALSGRLNWLVAAIAAVLPLLPRLSRLFLSLWPALLPYFRRYQQNKMSSMQTRFIKLQIDLLNGELQGEILQGQFKGQKLQLLSFSQLMQLLEECKREDSESAALLGAYLKRVHPEWEGSTASSGYSPTGSEMTEQQARDILGVSDTASKKDIIKAHKCLMQKLHPDRGGTDFLAQQINLAKTTLLKLF